jgi:CDP-paratose 2-epimerase
VILFDNLSRAGVHANAAWLRDQYGSRVELVVGDVRDRSALRAVVRRADRVVHLAAQVAVTTSVADPGEDFEVNARGTLEVLEAVRAHRPHVPVLFTSTNKVYGALPDLTFAKESQRWEPAGPLGGDGIDETRGLDLHSPYGCSKGAADQYVRDWGRTYGLATVVFRMSCIYGPRQFGTEDQGWVAHFLIRALQGERVTLYGDGCQVRDILFVDDLVDAFAAALDHLPAVRGRVFNMGGGPARAVSLLELLAGLESLLGRRVPVSFAEPRTGDQLWYVSNTDAFQRATGWCPRVSVGEGVRRLHEWLAPRYREAAVPAREAS